MKTGLLVLVVTVLTCVMNAKAGDLRAPVARPPLSAEEVAARKARLDEMTQRAQERESANRTLNPYKAATAAATDPKTGDLHLERLPAAVRVQHEAAVKREWERQQREDGPTELLVRLVGERPQWQLQQIVSVAARGLHGLHDQGLSRDECMARMREMLRGVVVSDAQLKLLLGVGSVKELWRRP